jgi:hypothetical protein
LLAYKLRKKSFAAFSPLRELHSTQLETRFRYEFSSIRARGST